MDWLDLLAVKGTLKNLLQHQSSKASILQGSVFFIVQLSHPYMTTGKTIALTRWTFVGKVMSLLFNMLSMLVIDGDCSHEIKRRLPSGRKAMTNLDNVLKSRNITLLTKELWCWRRLFRVLDNKEIQPVHPKGDQS